jgi:riboflavin biosynthesis pyrimidine reductase
VQDKIIQLYPGPSQEVSIKNLYVHHPLHKITVDEGEVFIYSNFITSLDGRIAIPHTSDNGLTVPAEIANARDWRLVQELTTQADLLITSGRYLREYAEGGGQKILHVYDDPRFSDLKEWRMKGRLKPWPDIAVISNHLDFPIPEDLARQGRSVIVITSKRADPKRIQDVESQGATVILSGEQHVEGKSLVDGLARLGYQRVYSITGPKVLHLLLEGNVLHRLYLTIAHRILGGRPFSTIVEGNLLEPSRGFQLRTLFFDPYGLEGLGQLFACYDRVDDFRGNK